MTRVCCENIFFCNSIFFQAFDAISSEGLMMMVSPLIYYIPRPGKFKYLMAWRALMKFLDVVIAEHRKNPQVLTTCLPFFWKDLFM
jgi:hypothetical protein